MSIKMLRLLEEPSVVQLRALDKVGGRKKRGYNSFILTVLYQLLHLLGAFTGKIFQIS